MADDQGCTSLAESGYWAGRDGQEMAIWQQEGCTTAIYQEEDIQECLEDKSITLIGDSTIRQIYWAISEKLHATVNRTAGHEAVQQAEGSKVDIKFLWDTYLHTSNISLLLEEKKRGIENDVGILVTGAGLHYAAWEGNRSFHLFKETMSNLFEPEPVVRADTKMAVYIMPVLPSNYPYVDPKVKNITGPRVDEMNDWIRNEIQFNTKPSFRKTFLWSYNEMVNSNKAAYDKTAVHVIDSVAVQKADILLNHYCNPILSQLKKLPKNASCCLPSLPRQGGQWFILSALLILLISASIHQLQSKQETGLASKDTSHAILFFCSALVFSFIADQTQAFGKLIKQHDQVQFVLLSLSAFLAIFFIHLCTTFKESNKAGSDLNKASNTFMNHSMTEEWKGWMQAVILLYHWTGSSTNLSVYKFIRLLVAAYLFMSGYGTTLAILKTQKDLLKKLCRQLIRLNILSIALSYTMATNYLDYYFAPLVSMWVIVTYACLGIFSSLNHKLALVSLKIVISCGLTTFFLFKDGIIESLFNVLEHTCNISLNAREWRFRAGLDPFIVYFGIFTALLVEKYREDLTDGDLESNDTKKAKEFVIISRTSARWKRIFSIVDLSNTAIGTWTFSLMSLFVIALWVLIASTQYTKASYNSIHPYISPLPVFGYVLLRHCHHYLFTSYSKVFARLGRCSLETFTLQYHLLLANNTAAVLSLPVLPHWHRVGSLRIAELAIIMIAFLFISEKVAQATGTLVPLLCNHAKASNDSSAGPINEYSVVAQSEEEQIGFLSPALTEDGSTQQDDHLIMTALPQYWWSGIASSFKRYLIISSIMASLITFNWLGYTLHK
jgi:hypothetical protein